MGALEQYRLWAEHPYFDPATREELAAIAQDQADVEERFARGLQFGTAGLRGVIAAGTNRMNRYVVRQTTQGLAEYIATFGDTARTRGVVIAHDSRHCSPEFALEAALTLNANGIVAYTWDSLRPTPMLSYAVRRLETIAGIVITASHNPKEYNGYKVYWEDGGQVPPERAAAIYQRICAISDFTAIHPMDEAEARIKGLLRQVPEAVDRSYFDRVVALARTAPGKRAACRILFTPLHGTGNIPVRQALGEAGFPVSVVREQADPDPDFPTIKNPNPEDPAVFALALRQARAEQPDVIMATDADADRLGLMARDKQGLYRQLTGNQIGVLLVDYLFATRDLPPNAAVVKSIASTNLVYPMCQAHGVALFETHTGFKFIGDIIQQFEETGSHTFLLGFEESYGYLGATFVRDKDAVMAALLVADAVAYYKAQEQTLWDALERVWQKYGYYQESTQDVRLEGRAGQERLGELMAGLRRDPPVQFGPLNIAYTDDYASGVGYDHDQRTFYQLALGRSNVLHYRFPLGGFVMVRPSGTEPKLKIYFSVKGDTEAQAKERLEAVRVDMLRRMGLMNGTGLIADSR